jgi:hypothetical protein
MSDEDVRTALEYCRAWNTNTRNCHAAHAMLKAILAHKRPAQLLDVPGGWGLYALLKGALLFTGNQRYVSEQETWHRTS